MSPFMLLKLMCRKELIPFENAKIVFVDEIFAIEKPGTQLNIHRLAAGNSADSIQQPLSELSSIASHCVSLLFLC